MSPSRMRQGSLPVRVDRKKDETIQAESKSLEPRKKVLDIRNTVRYNDGIKNKELASWYLIHWSRKISGTKKVLDSQSLTWYNELIKNGLVKLACSSLIIEYERVI